MGVILACIGIGACGTDTVSPEDVPGVYELHQMNGSPMPYDYQKLGCCTYLSGVIDIRTGSYNAGLTARNRNTGLVFTAEEWGEVEIDGSALTFQSDSFDIAPFLFAVGKISRDSILVAFGGEGPGDPDQFIGLFVAF
jgi:hypothetical protein